MNAPLFCARLDFGAEPIPETPASVARRLILDREPAWVSELIVELGGIVPKGKSK